MKTSIIAALILSSLLIMTVVLTVDRLYITGPDMAPALGGKLNQAQMKSIDLIVDLTKIVMAASLGVIGFISYYIKGEMLGAERKQTQISMIFLSTCFGMASIYFGHRVISTIVEMLANDYFALTGFSVARAVSIQYIFFCASVLCAIIFIVLRHAGVIAADRPPQDAARE